MSIHLLKLADFRNVANVDMQPATQGLNIITGQNGSGKTSLLESIYYLGLGKSFRTASANKLIRHQTQKCTVFAQIQHHLERFIAIGVERDRSGAVKMKMDEQTVAGLTEIAMLMPIRLLNTQSHQLLDGGPLQRRQYLDWGVFYQFPTFLSTWRHYERALKQRNALLRERKSQSELATWTYELHYHGKALDALRRAYVEKLKPHLAEIWAEYFALPALDLTYYPGWDASLSYEDALHAAAQEEWRLGYTPYGPHRADLELNFTSGSVKHFLSRGQQKLLICAMMAAQGKLLQTCVAQPLIYLVDDLPAELDRPGQATLMRLLSAQKTQVFITAITAEAEWVKQGLASKMFHVEHGKIEER